MRRRGPGRAVALACAFCLVAQTSLAGTGRPLRTVDDLRRRHPGAQLVCVSPEEFQQAKEAYEGRNAVVEQELPPELAAPPPAAPPPSPEPPPAPPPEAATEPSPCADVNAQCVSSGNWGGDAAKVLFVVIGVVVVAVLVIYGGVYLYHAATGGLASHWWDAGLQSTLLFGEGDRESGSLTGFKVAGGFAERGLQIGLAAEFGYLDLALRLEDDAGRGRRVDLQGLYGVIGPAVRFLFERGPNPPCLQLELLAGTSEDHRLGLLSVARLGLTWGFGERLRVGVSAGAIYTDLDETDALVRQTEFDYLLGVEGGYRF